MENEKQNAQWLAKLFTDWRAIIESAETPFAKLAVFVLPVIAPMVPASLTSLHLYTLFVGNFDFPAIKFIALLMSILTGIVLELLGYVGAIATVRAIYNVAKAENAPLALYVPVVLNGLSYGFYLLALITVNYYLGQFLGEEPIVTNIVAILSLVTIPTGLLAANHLNETAEEEKAEKLRKELLDREARERELEREHKLRKLEIRSGKFQESSNTSVESSEKVPDWRKLKSTLTQEQLQEMANWTPDQMNQMAKTTGKTYKTFSNYRARARAELGLE